jgi:hypothetical protein
MCLVVYYNRRVDTKSYGMDLGLTFGVALGILVGTGVGVGVGAVSTRTSVEASKDLSLFTPKRRTLSPLLKSTSLILVVFPPSKL